MPLYDITGTQKQSLAAFYYSNQPVDYPGKPSHSPDAGDYKNDCPDNQEDFFEDPGKFPDNTVDYPDHPGDYFDHLIVYPVLPINLSDPQ